MAGRPKGSRSGDYADKRRALLRDVRDACFARPTDPLSFREMAAAANTSVPTLKHYFENREGLVTAILEQAWKDAADWLAPSYEPEQPLEDKVSKTLEGFYLGITRFGLDKLHVWGMSEGLGSAVIGPAYLNYFLEPTLQGAENWLEQYRAAGQIAEGVDVRHAAITLYAPCLVLMMHQNYLGGTKVREADMPAFFDEHASRFLAYVGAA